MSFARLLAACLSVASLLTASPAAAQTPTSLRGTVVDTTGGALSGATVLVESLGSVMTRVGETGRDGVFEIGPLAPGAYRVTVAAPGFGARTLEVALPAPAPVRIALAPAPVVEEVRVVSASRQEELRQSLHTRVDVISRGRLEESGAETVGEVLREIPGVMTRRGSEGAGPAEQQVQGIDSRQVLVLLDGQPVPGARGIKRGVINLDRQSTARLERIEVVKGAASALYGSDAIGGVINLITRDAAAPLDLGLAASGGSFGDLNAHAELGGRRHGWSGLFVAERHQNDGFDLTPATFDATAASLRRHDVLAKGSGRLTPAWTLSALAWGYANRAAGRSNGELGAQIDDIRDDAASVGVTASWLVRPALALDIRGYVSRFDERSSAMRAGSGEPLAPSTLDEDIDKIDASFSYFIGARQQVQGGAEYVENRYAGLNRIAFDKGVSASTAVGWLQHRAAVGDRLTTTAGVRVDRHSSFGTAVSPKVAGTFRLRDGWHVRASYGRGFRAPDLGQRFYRFLNASSIYQVIGNPGLEPEYARSLQAGADWLSSGRRVRLGVNVFRNDVRDLIDSVSLGFVATPAQLAALLEREGLDPSFRPVLGRLLFTYKNVHDALTYGLELDGELALSRAISIGGAYTNLHALDAATDVKLTNRHEHHGHVRVSWHAEALGLRANLRATAYSKWIAARSAGADTIAPGFTLWDVFVSQELPHGLVVFGAVDNLMDSQDPNTGLIGPDGRPAPIYRPDAGRTFRVGVRWSWLRR